MSTIKPLYLPRWAARFANCFAKAALVTGLLCASAADLRAQNTSFKETNLLSDGFVPAKATDPTFINPWGVSLGKTFWTNSAAGGYNALNDINGAVAFKVTVPGSTAGTLGAPSATVAQTGTAFLLPNGKSGSFIFATLGGTVAAWNGGLGTAGSIAVNMVDRSALKAAYTGMSLDTNATGTYLLLADFSSSVPGIEVYDSTWKPTTLSGTFTDPKLPAGFYPFAIHTIGSQVFVTYIQKNSSGRELVQAGNGIVDVFDLNGNFVSTAIAGGNLNSPWGMAKAPATYGIYANDLLVGNFGDGVINVYDPSTFGYLGQITDGTGTAINFPGLWEILFGGGVSGSLNGDANVLYFAAGISGEAHGLFGSIDNTGTGAPGFGFSGSTSNLAITDGTTGQLTLALDPTNGFSGPVTLTCAGQPAQSTCSFGQATVSVGATTPANTTMSIATTATRAANSPLKIVGHHSGIFAAFGLPFLGLLGMRRRLSARMRGLLILPVLLLSFAVIGTLAGCAGSNATPTPTGTSAVTVTAVSGNLSKTMTVNVVVQ